MSLYLTLAARYLWGRKLRTFLTTLAIVFGVLVIFASNTIMPSMLAAFQGNVLAASGQADVTVRQKLGEAFKPSLVGRVKGVSGVHAAAGSLQRSINIPTGYYGHDVDVGALTLVGVEARSILAVRNYSVAEGRFLTADDDDAAVITTNLAESLHLRVGDTLRLPATEGVAKLKIVGLLSARALPGNEEVLVNLPKAQGLLGAPGRINTIEARLNTTDSQQAAAIATAIEDALGTDYQTEALASGGQIYAALQMGQYMFGAIGFLVLFMGGFIILNTFRTVIAERRRDIGMLRALGANRRTILGIVLAEGALQGAVGTLAGMVLGYLLSAGLLAALSPMYEQFLHLKVGEPVISIGTLVWTPVLGVGMTLLAGLFPAISAGRVTPLEALRPQVAESGRQAGGKGPVVGAVLLVLAALGLVSGNLGLTALGTILLLVGLALVSPVLVGPVAHTFGRLLSWVYSREGTASLAQGNMVRQPGRAANTATTTMAGLALLIAAGGMVASLIGFALGAMRKSLGSDYLLVPPAVGLWDTNIGASRGLADRLRALPGVEAVSTMRFAQTEIDGDTVSVLGIDPVAFPRVAGLDVSQGDPATVYAELAGGRTLVANWILAGQASLKPGDVVRLATPKGAKEYRVVGVAGDYYNAKIATVYISQANLRADFNKTEDVFLQIKRSAGMSPAELEPRLRAAVERYPQFRLVSGDELLGQIEPQMQAMMSSMYIALAVLAVPSLIALLNTLAIGVIERLREIGMLRAIGATRRQVRRIVIAEALLLAALGTAIGVVAGLYLAYVTVRATAVAGYPVAFSFPSAAIGAAVIVGLSFGVLAALLPARQAARLQIVEALRFE